MIFVIYFLALLIVNNAGIIQNSDFELNPISSGGTSYLYYTNLTNWVCSTGLGGGFVIIRSTDTAWGGGGCPSGGYYLGLQVS